jgi:hypothetical protein
MEAQVIAAFVTAAASIFVAVIGKEGVWNFFKLGASKRNEYLLGAWECTWDTVAPATTLHIQDRATITRVRGNLVKGNGSTPNVGDWDLDGRAGRLAVSFSYSIKGHELPGAVVLKSTANDQMSGAWAQYSNSGEVISGTTIWRRVK